jgi:hypothetical protein
MKAKPKPTTRSLFAQLELDEESETEFQHSEFDFPSTHAVQNVIQEVLRFSELSSKEQLAHIEMDPPAEIEDSSFFHDGIQYSVSARDFSPTRRDEAELPASSSAMSASTSMRPPNSFSEPSIEEWRYTIPLAPAVSAARVATESAVNAAAPPRVVPIHRAPVASAPPVAAPPLMPMPGVVPEALFEPLFPPADPEPVFGAITLGTDFVPEYLPLVLPSPVLAARFLSRVSIQDLSIGLAVLVLGFAAGIVSAETLQAPVAAYLVVNKSPDGSTDAVLAYPSNTAGLHNFPKLITFMPAIATDQSTVIILNESGVRARYLPALADAAKLFQVTLVGAAIGAPLSATVSPASMLYDTPESQLKREAREEKLAAVTVCLRGDLQAVNAFVGPARDLGHDSVLARIYPMLSVAQRACPWARPECLPLFLQFLFSPSYLVLKGQGINLTAQHLLPTSRSDSAVQIETVNQIEQCVQAMCSGFTTLYCQPGSPLHKLDPLFFYNITVPLLEQLRSTTHQSEYLGALPINCVVQAFNGCLAALGSFMRNTANASLPFAEFQAGAMATLDLKPRETVIGAYTAIHCQDLFVVQQFNRFDGKSMSAPTVPAISYPPQSRKRPLPQSGPPPLRQRTSLVSAAPRANPGRPAPIVARVPYLGGNNPAPRAGPPLAGGAPQYICVSDFVSKIDGVRYPLGCTTPNCPRRHVPLPALGQFAAADKAELLQSLSRMKGTRVAPMIALIQGRN